MSKTLMAAMQARKVTPIIMTIPERFQKDLSVFLMAVLYLIPLVLRAASLGTIQVTATQASIPVHYTGSTCTVDLYSDPAHTLPLADTNPALFTNADYCSRSSSVGSAGSYTMVVGLRTSQVDLNSHMTSRALPAASPIYGVLTADTTVNFSFVTANPPTGNTFPEPAPFNASAPYNFAWPTIRPMIDRNTWITDPTTGVQFELLSLGVVNGGAGSAFVNQVNMGLNASPAANSFDAAGNGNWSNNTGATINNTNSGANQDPLFIAAPNFCVGIYGLQPPGSSDACPQENGGNTWGGYLSPDDFQATFQIACTGATASAGFQMAITLDGVNRASDWESLTCGSIAPVTYPPSGAISGGAITAPGYPSTVYGTSTNATVFGYWFANQATSRLTRPDMQPHTGTCTLASGVCTWASGEFFRPSSMSAGSYINLALAPSATTSPYRITAITSPASVTIASPPADGTYNYIYQGLGVLIRKAGNTTGNLTVCSGSTSGNCAGSSGQSTFSDWEDMVVQMPLIGVNELCANYTVTDANGIVGRLCDWAAGGNIYHPMFFIEEVSGKGRFLGLMEPYLGGCSTGNCTTGVTGNHQNDWGSVSNNINGSLFTLVQNHWVNYANAPNHLPSATLTIVDGYYNPAASGSCPNNYQEITPANCPSFPYNSNNTYNNVTPSVGTDAADHTPLAVATAYAAAHSALPVFSPSQLSGGNLAPFGPPPDALTGWVEVCSIGGGNNQNYMSWCWDMDPAASPPYSVVAMVNDYSGYGCRFCGTHATGTQNGYKFIATEPNLAPGGNVGQGDYLIQTTTSLNNTQTQTCSGITDPNYSAYNGISQCVTLALSALDVCWNQPSPGAPMFGTCSWNGSYSHLIQSGSTPINTTVGELFDDGNGSTGEVFRLVSISGLVGQFIRAYATPNNGPGTPPNTSAGYSTIYGTQSRYGNIASHTAPWTLRELCSGGPSASGGTIWMNLNTDPTGQAAIPDYTMQINGHADFWTFSGTSLMDMGGRARFASSLVTGAGQPGSFIAVDQAPFNSWSGATAGGVQSHGSVSRYPASPNYETDANALSNISIASNQLWAQTADNVTGALWHIAAANVRGYVSGSWPALLKSTPYVMWSGGYLLQDISKPSSVIDGTSLHNWQFCIVWIAGECVSGSSVGDVYVNVPQSAHNSGPSPGYCGGSGSWDYNRSICGVTIDQTAGGVNQFNLNGIPTYAQTGQALTITDGRTFRQLSKIANRYNFQNVFASTHNSYNGSWTFSGGDFYGSGMRNDIMSIKTPALPPSDTVQRGAFVNVAITAGASNVANARLRFGYAENETNGNWSGNYYCAYNRKEACLTNPSPTSTIPYYFAGDASQSYTACSSGCTLLLPAIPGRTVYYRIERVDNSGNIIAAGPVQITGVN
jgi:hypothetical protein